MDSPTQASDTFRHAVVERGEAREELNEQRGMIPAERASELEAVLEKLTGALQSRDEAGLAARLAELREAAGRILPSRSDKTSRRGVELALKVRADLEDRGDLLDAGVREEIERGLVELDRALQRGPGGKGSAEAAKSLGRIAGRELDREEKDALKGRAIRARTRFRRGLKEQADFLKAPAKKNLEQALQALTEDLKAGRDLTRPLSKLEATAEKTLHRGHHQKLQFALETRQAFLTTFEDQRDLLPEPAVEKLLAAQESLDKAIAEDAPWGTIGEREATLESLGNRLFFNRPTGPLVSRWLRVIRWHGSKLVRQAVDMRKQVEKFLNQQKDLLTGTQCDCIRQAVAGVNDALWQRKFDEDALMESLQRLETTANRRLIPYPNASIRENIDVILVAVAVALGVRTFFLQPFKIPTGSMQPTLYGITHEDYRNDPDFKPPSAAERFMGSCFNGESYIHLVASGDCSIESLDVKDSGFGPFKKRRIKLSNESEPRTIHFIPDKLFERSRLYIGQRFSEGEDIINMRVIKGDHLFVDRFTYNFRRPERGEIIVFKTAGIPGLQQDLFYIKRLVALGGERVRIGDDHHVRINGERLDAATSRFENVYTFDPQEWSDVGHVHFGHVNGRVSIALKGQNLSPLFYGDDSEFVVGANRYMVFGDNTMNSLDSRQWGDFPRENVIGKSAFVYWPFNKRFGWSHR